MKAEEKKSTPAPFGVLLFSFVWVLGALSAATCPVALANDTTAAAPAKAVKQKRPTLDLTQHIDAFNGFRDCLIRLRKEEGKHFLVGSKTKVNIPQGAVIRIVNETFALVRAKGSLLGMPFSEIYVPIEKAGEPFTGTWSSFSPKENKGFVGSQYGLVFEAPQARVRGALTEAWGATFIQGEQEGPNPDLNVIVYHNVGGFPKITLESASEQNSKTYFYYYCVINGGDK